MPAAARLEDFCTGHDFCASRALITASTNVRINGRGAARVNDQFATHGCDAHSPHNDKISSGSNTVRINGIPAARLGDPVTLAGSVKTASENVFIGG